MTRWHSCPLGDAIELAYGKSLPKDGRNQTGSVPVYGSNGITGWHDVAIVNQPTVIVGRKGSAGAVQYVAEPCYPIDTTYFVRPRAGFQFDSKFLFYLLKKLDLSRLKTATGVPGLTREDAYRESISFPPIEEQRRIVDLLSRAEGIVRLRHEAQQKAAELVPAIFLEMFGDPAANPKGWPVVSLGEALAAVDYGSSTKASDTGEGVPLIRMGNVGFDGDLNLSNLKYVQLDDAAVEKYALRKGDILFNRTNSKDLVGKTGLWDGGMHAVVASYFIRLRVDEGMLVPTYLWALMNGRHMKKVLFETARGAIGQANINSKELKAFRVPLPPMPLQRAFEHQVESVRSICTQQANALTKADATFAALLSKAFPL